MTRPDWFTTTPEDAHRWAAEPDDPPMTRAELADEAALDREIDRRREVEG